jgi:tetratricopeptide (TPR) repeat protein
MKKPMEKRTPLRQKITLIALGLFLSLVLLEAGLRFSGWVFSSVQEYRNKLSLRNKGTYRILCLGESTTALGGENSYPRQLEKILNERNPDIKFSVVNKGVIGITSVGILGQLDENLKLYKPDMIIAMMGINDGAAYALEEGIFDSQGNFFEKMLNEYRLFFKSLRVYKLAGLIQLHLAAKVGKQERESRTKEDGKKNDIKEEWLKKAVQMSPGSVEALINLGAYYLGRGSYKQAEESFNRAIEMDTGNRLAYTSLWVIYVEQRRFAEAEGLLLNAAKVRNGLICYELGRCYAQQDKYAEAEEWF